MKRKIFIVVLFLLMFSFVVSLSVAEEVSKEYKEYVMKVTGKGKISIEPDSFMLVFLVESESVNLRRATKDNAEKIADIMKEIKKLEIPNVEFSTSIFNFAGDKDYAFILPGKKCKIKNEVTVKAEKLKYDDLSGYASGIIDTSIQEGATKVRGLSFYLENEKIAEDKALKAALDNAKDKASFIAKELGVTLNKPYNVLGFWFHRPEGLIMYERAPSDYMMMKQAETRPQVVAGKEIFTAQVELEYKFE